MTALSLSTVCINVAYKYLRGTVSSSIGTRLMMRTAKTHRTSPRPPDVILSTPAQTRSLPNHHIPLTYINGANDAVYVFNEFQAHHTSRRFDMGRCVLPPPAARRRRPGPVPGHHEGCPETVQHWRRRERPPVRRSRGDDRGRLDRCRRCARGGDRAGVEAAVRRAQAVPGAARRPHRSRYATGEKHLPARGPRPGQAAPAPLHAHRRPIGRGHHRRTCQSGPVAEFQEYYRGGQTQEPPKRRPRNFAL